MTRPTPEQSGPTIYRLNHEAKARGDTTFLAPQPCSKHPDCLIRRVTNRCGICIECKRESNRRNSRKDPGKSAARVRRFLLKNPEKAKQRYEVWQRWLANHAIEATCFPLEQPSAAAEGFTPVEPPAVPKHAAGMNAAELRDFTAGLLGVSKGALFILGTPDDLPKEPFGNPFPVTPPGWDF